MSNGSDSEQQVEDSSPLLGTVVAVQANYYQVKLDTQESEGTNQESGERIFNSSSPLASESIPYSLCSLLSSRRTTYDLRLNY